MLSFLRFNYKFNQVFKEKKVIFDIFSNDNIFYSNFFLNCCLIFFNLKDIQKINKF